MDKSSLAYEFLEEIINFIEDYPYFRDFYHDQILSKDTEISFLQAAPIKTLMSTQFKIEIRQYDLAGQMNSRENIH
mgnify:CR=1 FL=1